MNDLPAAMPAEIPCPRGDTSLPPGAPVGLCPACLPEQGVAGDTGAGQAGFARFDPPSVAELAGHFPQLEILEVIREGRGRTGRTASGPQRCSTGPSSARVGSVRRRGRRGSLLCSTNVSRPGGTRCPQRMLLRSFDWSRARCAWRYAGCGGVTGSSCGRRSGGRWPIRRRSKWNCGRSSVRFGAEAGLLI